MNKGIWWFGGGIGDFIQFEAWVPERPKKMLLATSRAGEIGELCHHLKIPVEIMESQKSWLSKADCECYHGKIDAEDGSVNTWFPLCLKGAWKWHGSGLLDIPIPNIVSFNYSLVMPFSLNADPNRNFQMSDFNYAFAHSMGMPLLVVGYGHYPIRENPLVINLMNKTSLLETIGLVKFASRIFTIDSWQSQLAAQLDVPVWIKSRNEWYYKNADVYAAPRKKNVKIQHFLNDMEEFDATTNV